MHFLIGLLIVCIIIAVPQLRAAALIIAGVAFLAVLAVIAASSSHRQAAATAVPPPSAEQVQQASAALRAFDNRQRTLIDPGELRIRSLWLTQWGQPVRVPNNVISDAVVHAVVRNGSSKATLTRIGLKVSLYDCPAHAADLARQCDKIGELAAAVRADIPPGQVREMASPDTDARSIEHLPPLAGVFRLDYAIDYLCASDGSAPPGDTYLAERTGLVCATP